MSRNILSDLFYSMAKTYRKEDLHKLMVKIDKVDYKSIAACINGCIIKACKLSLFEFLEEVRILFGSLNYKTEN